MEPETGFGCGVHLRFRRVRAYLESPAGHACPLPLGRVVEVALK